MIFDFVEETMRRKNARAVLASSVLALLGIGTATPQTGLVQNPMEGDPKALEQGMHMYRHRCGVCHGLDGLGYQGPDLKNGPWLHGDSDADLFRVISRGVPGSEMGPARLQEDEVWMVIAYLRSLRSSGTDQEEPGNAAAGEEIYWDKGSCEQCHRINGRGGRLGPDLSRIGAARSRTALMRELRSASEYYPPGYEPVTVLLRDGRRIAGVRKNEDTFSIQLMDVNEELHLLLKSDLLEVIHEEHSLMPDYGVEQLTDAELDDLLSYLRTLGTTAASARPVKEGSR